MYVYMYVTTDKYELPIAIADSPKELAAILGTTNNAVSSAISHKKGKNPNSLGMYVKVWIDEYENEEGVENENIVCND